MKRQMKKCIMKNCGVHYCMIVLLFAFIVVMPLKASADLIDDFENGDYEGWNETIIYGSSTSGSFDVEEHNDSNMAFVYHAGGGTHSLSQDFAYLGDSVLSFDMQATADANGSRNANTGVQISFLNSINSTIGSLTIMNATNPDAQPDEYFMVDNTQHTYTNLMSEWAALAGLAESDPISTISLNFFATASYASYAVSSSKVWFDNVSISAVPIPGAVWLLGSGIIGVVGLRRRRS